MTARHKMSPLDKLSTPFRLEPMEAPLRAVITAFLAGDRLLTPTEMLALKLYLRRWIVGRAKTIVVMEHDLESLEDPGDFQRWLTAARCADFDPN
jgi:hypothetical protein